MSSIWLQVFKKLGNAVSFKNDTSQKGNEPSPVIRAELYIPPPITERYDADQRDNRARERKRFFLDLVTLAVIVGGFVVLLQTLWATWDAVSAAQQQAEAAKGEMEAAKEQVKIARQALEDARESSRVDQRAWISVKSVKRDFLGKEEDAVVKVGDFLGYEIVFQNTGKTPARGATVMSGMELVRIGGRPNFSYETNPTVRPGLIAPGGETLPISPLMTERRNIGFSPLSPRIASLLRQEELQIHIHGRVSYQDVFDKCHWVTFCYSFHPRDFAIPVACEDHNDTGDEDCKDHPQ
jgi:hypothetical protein